MRYKLRNGILIRSENAAKPASQKSHFLSDLIRDFDVVESSFDYGCGKLRYRDEMLSVTQHLSVIDSDIQLSREQIIVGEKTTVRDFSKRSNRLSALSLHDVTRYPDRFERGFCINVLSVIPIMTIRKRVLSVIKSILKPGGTCLFTVQYRNSDFTRMSKLPNARKWLDGFLLDSRRGYSFYGMIRPEELFSLVSEAGFVVQEQKLYEGSVFLSGLKPTEDN